MEDAAHLTIIEMLDLLEAEIVGLRARNQELEMAAGAPVTSGPNAARKRTPQARSSAKKKKKAAKRKPPVRTAKGDQLDLLAGADAAQAQSAPEAPRVGKRQALGKSIVQLRRIAAPRAL